MKNKITTCHVIQEVCSLFISVITLKSFKSAKWISLEEQTSFRKNGIGLEAVKSTKVISIIVIALFLTITNIQLVLFFISTGSLAETHGNLTQTSSGSIVPRATSSFGCVWRSSDALAQKWSREFIQYSRGYCTVWTPASFLSDTVHCTHATN